MSELRKDPLSGDWIILSPGRAKRPQLLAPTEKKIIRKPSPIKKCPFEDLLKSGNGEIFEAWPNKKKWKIAVVPNKYPALAHGETCAVNLHEGFYEAKSGIGTHELLITRDHVKFFADLSPSDAAEVLKVFQSRYHAANDGCNVYAVAFLNYGPSVGASVWHPHYQLLAIPFVPPHVSRSLRGAEEYFKHNGRCLRCDLLEGDYRGKNRVRIVDENKHAVALTPYASKRPFEVRVIPKKHFARFEETPPAVIGGVAEMVQSVLERLRKYVGDPDLNFFIHDAPFTGKHPYHHWHAEVLPNMSYLGGLEFSTGIYINTVDPEEAAKTLRGE